MANTVSLLGFTNTFGDMLARINSLAQENNALATTNYIKSTGTFQVSSNLIVGGTLFVQGLGSTVSIQNGLTANTLILANTTANQLLIGGGASGVVKSIANTGTPGTYANSSYIPVITTDAYGRVSNVSNTQIAIDSSQIVTGLLPVSRGGTGVSASTGSGSNVLSNSPTLSSPTFTSPVLGTPTSGNFSSGTFTWPTFNQNTTGNANSSTYSANAVYALNASHGYVDSGFTSFNWDAAGFCYRLVASSTGTNAIIQWTNNAQSVQWTSLVGTNGNLKCTTTFSSDGEINSNYNGTGQFRAVWGNYGLIFRNDGSNFYLLGTASGDAYGSWNAYRPFTFNFGNGAVTLDGTGSGTYLGGNLNFNNYSAITWPNNVAIYEDTGVGDLVVRTFNGAYHYSVFYNNGDFGVPGNVTAYSDKRVKDNLIRIPDALKKVNSLNGYTYTRIDQEDKDKRYTGVIAQEVLEVLPEAVTEDKDGRYSVAYGNMVGILIEAIKELTQEVESLKKKLGE